MTVTESREGWLEVLRGKPLSVPAYLYLPMSYDAENPGPWESYLNDWDAANRAPNPWRPFRPDREARACFDIYHIEALHCGDEIVATGVDEFGPHVTVEEGAPRDEE